MKAMLALLSAEAFRIFRRLTYFIGFADFSISRYCT